MSTRRKLIIAIGASTLVMPVGSFAQRTGKVWRITVLSHVDQSTLQPWIAVFNREMRIEGYVADTDYVIELRATNGNVDRIPEIALAATKADLIIASSTATTLAAMKATNSIPIVFVAVGDPINVGIVPNLSRPGGNVTGFSNVAGELIAKRLELMRELLPKLNRIGFLFDPGAPNEQLDYETLRSVARKFAIRVVEVYAKEAATISKAFDSLMREKAQAVIVAGGRNTPRRAMIAEQAMKHRLPTLFGNSEGVEAGGLISYGSDISDQYRRAATYVAKIFKGTRPGDLPIQLPTKFDLVINMKTAKALGLTIPNSILVQATKVIE